LDEFASNLSKLKKETKLCSVCKNVAETDPCPICSDPSRDKTTILVVEEPLDIIAFEKTGKYQGVYHVLHGAINPLENIGPDEIYINELVQRVSNGNAIEEVIVGTNPTMEGEATAMYLSKKLKIADIKLKISRLGMGIPTGADLEYADETTLRESLSGRRVI
jgi:recombination protein RecR